MKVVLVIGLPGSGKTCWAQSELSRLAMLGQVARLLDDPRSLDEVSSTLELARKGRCDAVYVVDQALCRLPVREQAKAWLRGQGITPDPHLHIEGGDRLDGPAVNPANAEDAVRQWRESHPQAVIVDNLLTDAALAALRRFCLGSTLWRTGYGSGYLGTFPEHGFSVPLLAQIAEEFRSVYSGICGDLPLKYAWAFKYDSSMEEGVHIHADDAAVNVNFWITPDEANLDPESGGLLVWDVPAPHDWDFTRFNRDQPAIRDFLSRSGARAITVPYRGNRAVIFNSNLLHKTDRIRFRQGYENHRINVTLLYGERFASTLV